MLEQTSLHSRVIILMCGLKGHLVWEEETLLLLHELRVKVKRIMSRTSFATNPIKPVFFVHHTPDCELRQKQLPTFRPVCPSHLVLSDSLRPKNERWLLNITADVAPNTPVVHTCFLAQSVQCVPYKPCHALLFTICAPSQIVRKGGRKKRWERRWSSPLCITVKPCLRSEQSIRASQNNQEHSHLSVLMALCVKKKALFWVLHQSVTFQRHSESHFKQCSLNIG